MATTAHQSIPMRYWPLWLLIQVVRIIILLLPFRLCLILGKYSGRLFYYFPSKAKQVAQINIAACFSDLSGTEQQTLLKENFESMGICLFETLLAWWAPSWRIAKLAHIQGMPHIETLLKERKCIIALGGHFWPMEMAGRLFSLYFDFSVIFRAPPNPLLNAVLTMARRTHYNQLHERSSLRALVKQLSEGVPLWYSPDVDPGRKKSGVFAPFFNVSAYSLTATSRLATMSHAAVLMVSYFRRADGKGYDLTIHPPLDNFPSDDPVKDATRINQLMEDIIRKAPAQYLWQYKRFRTRPEGEKPFYP